MAYTIPTALLDACERGEITEPQLLRHVIETTGLSLDVPPCPALRYTSRSILRRLLHYVLASPTSDDEARRDLAALLKLPPESREATITAAYKRYRSPELARLLLEQSEQERTTNPPAALHFAQLVHLVLLECPETAQADDLRVLQLAYQGAAAKACGNLAAAEHAFLAAREAFADHFAPHLRVEAEQLFLEGSYRKDRRQLTAAEQLLCRSLDRFDFLGDALGAAGTRLALAATYFYSHRSDESLSTLQAAIAALCPEQQPLLYLMAQHNLTVYLAETDQPSAAAHRFKANQPLYKRLRSRWPNLQLHFHWLAGKIQRGLGEYERAEDHLVRARDGFATHGTAYDAIMVCLDLALVYAAQRRHRELAELADLMLTGFAAQGLHEEAIAAVAFAAEAARQRRLTAEIARAVSDFLLFAQHDPSLRCKFSSA